MLIFIRRIINTKEGMNGEIHSKEKWKELLNINDGFLNLS